MTCERLETLEPRRMLALAPHGPEFAVAAHTTADQSRPAVATDAAGNFVVAWSSDGQDGSGWGVYARLYDARGAARGDEFAVAEFTTGDQTSPSVAMDADGDVVVAWVDAARDGSGAGVFARQFDATGAPRGPDFRVGEVTAGAQDRPAVAADDAGNFVVVWDDAARDASDLGVYARMFYADGTPRAPDFRVNVAVAGRQWRARVAVDPVGDFVVTWEGRDNSGSGIRARRFARSGAPLADEIDVNPLDAGEQVEPDVAKSAEGDFTIVWTDMRQDAAGDIWACAFDGTFVTTPSAQLINAAATAGAQRNARVAADASNEWVVTWESAAAPGEPTDVLALALLPTLYTSAAPDVVNAHTAGSQSAPAVARTVDGDFNIAWQSDAQDGSGAGVYAQRFRDLVRPPASQQWRVTAPQNAPKATPAVAANTAGQFVLAWEARGPGATGYAIFAQAFGADATPAGGAVQVSGYTSYIGFQYPRVTIDPAGNFVVVWSRPGANLDDVFARCFTATGEPRTDEFRVNVATGGDQREPSVASTAGGAFVVAWQGPDGGDTGVFARRYDALGAPQGGEVRINAYTTGYQVNPAVAADADGNVVLAWHGHHAEPGLAGVRARRFGPDGQPLGDEFLAYQVATESSPRLAVEPDGDFVVMLGTRYRRFTSGGVGGPTVAFDYPNHGDPELAVAPDGSMFITWRAGIPGFGGASDPVIAQRVFGDDALYGERFRVNQYTLVQSRGVPAVDGAGNVVVVWKSQDPRTGESVLYARRYPAVPPPAVTAAQFLFETAPHRVRATFSRDVSGSLGTDDLRVANLTTGQTLPAGAFSLTYDLVTDAATFAYNGAAGALPDGRYRATLLAAGIADAAGLGMSADVATEFHVLRGDANGDGRVDLADFNILAANFGQSPRTFSQGDFNYDGAVNLQDFNLLAGRFGRSVAPGSIAMVDDKAEQDDEDAVDLA